MQSDERKIAVCKIILLFYRTHIQYTNIFFQKHLCNPKIIIYFALPF